MPEKYGSLYNRGNKMNTLQWLTMQIEAVDITLPSKDTSTSRREAGGK